MKDRYSATFFTVGGCCVVAGGLVAAATGPLALTDGPWLAAFLVLVCGVAQCALGVAQSALAPVPPTRRVFSIELLCWNLGNAAVIIGTLLRMPILVDVGGALLVVALALMILAVRGSTSSRHWLLLAYRLLIAVLLISIPVGLILAALRAV